MTPVTRRSNLVGMLRISSAVALVVVVGCGGGTDRASETCGRVIDAACAKLVECRAEASPGVAFTAANCQQIHAQAVSRCVMEAGASVAAATDSQVNACVQGYAAFACANLCNQVPMDPAACQVIDPAPGMDRVTCVP